METNKAWDLIAETIAKAKTALLATIDDTDQPQTRWVTPIRLADHGDSLFVATVAGSRKVAHIFKNEHVQWSIQSPTLDTIITLNAQATISEHAGLISELMEIAGVRLRTFWKINLKQARLVAIETAPVNGYVYYPVTGVTEKIFFQKS